MLNTSTVCFLVLAALFQDKLTPQPVPMPAPQPKYDWVKHVADCDDAIYNGSKVKFLVIEEPEVFEKEWKKYVGDKPLPKIEFKNNLAVLILSGAQHSGGYSIKVSDIKTDKVKTNIVVQFREPNPLANEGQAKRTSPYVVITVKKENIDLKNHYFFLFVKKISYPVFAADVVKE